MASRGSGSRGSDFDGIEVADRDPRRGGRKKAPRRSTGKGGSRRILTLRNVFMVALGGAILALVAVAGVFVYFGSDPKLPSIKKMGDYNPPRLTRVLDRDGKLIGELGSEKRTLVPFAEIPKVLVNAVVASEDADYWKHQGIDYRAVVRAVIANVTEARFAQGFSTITQQVVKQLLLTPEKSLRRKVQEVILARQLSQYLSKEEILEIYLNHMNYGHGRYGCEEASRYYFNKSVREITAGEAALLAGVLQLPTKLSPYRNPEGAKKRQVYVLDQMAKLGYLTRKEAQRLAAEPIKVHPETAARTTFSPEAVDGVRRFLVEKFGKDSIDTLGQQVKTTIDARLQELARASIERGLEDLDARLGFRGPSGRLTSAKAIERHKAALAKTHGGKPRSSAIIDGVVERVEKKGKSKGRLHVNVGGLVGVVELDNEPRYTVGPKPLADRFKPGDLVRVRAMPERKREGGPLPLALELGPQAAMVVLDPQSHEVLALVGGYRFGAGGFDRSQRALLQPGSAFKPFVYAAAIESKKFSAASIVNDAPEVYGLWKPKNYEREAFRGPVRLRVALAHSINTVAIKLLADVGFPAARDLANRAGIVTAMPEDLGLAMALGANNVTPIELANAYATFVSGGQRRETRLVRAVGTEEVPPAEPTAALSAESAYVVVSLMRSVVEEGTARQVSARLRRPAAGKTGTTNEAKDVWFVGFTPDLLAAVWVGFDDRKQLGGRESAGKTAVPIWLDFMSKALMGRPARDFAQPPGVNVVQIDAATGLRPAPGAEGLDEVFLAGTEPTEAAPAQGHEGSADKILLEN